MKKVLGMNDPFISSFPVYGDLFSIVKPSKNMDYWICNNFIQLRRVNPVIFFESYRSILYNCPHVATTKITRDILKCRWNNQFFQFVKDMIDMHCYVFMYVDRAYLQIYKTTESLVHEFFIYGYDEDEHVFFCADNADGGKYIKFICSSREVEEAYWNIVDYSYYTELHCIKFIANEPDRNWFESIKISQINELLSAYMESRITVNFSERFNIKETGFVLQEKEINKLKQREKEWEWVDWRPFCVFKEHKKIMVFRLTKLNEVYESDTFTKFTNAYALVEEEYKMIINLIVKYNITHEKKLLDKIVGHGEKAISAERDALPELKKRIEMYLD